MSSLPSLYLQRLHYQKSSIVWEWQQETLEDIPSEDDLKTLYIPYKTPPYELADRAPKVATYWFDPQSSEVIAGDQAFHRIPIQQPAILHFDLVNGPTIEGAKNSALIQRDFIAGLAKRSHLAYAIPDDISRDTASITLSGTAKELAKFLTQKLQSAAYLRHAEQTDAHYMFSPSVITRHMGEQGIDLHLHQPALPEQVLATDRRIIQLGDINLGNLNLNTRTVFLN